MFTRIFNQEISQEDMEILQLYHGMSETMQIAVKEIMQVTQKGENK